MIALLCLLWGCASDPAPAPGPAPIPGGPTPPPSPQQGLWAQSRPEDPGPHDCFPPMRFQTQREAILSVDPAGTWRNQRVACPNLVERQGQRALYFQYTNQDGTSGIGRMVHTGQAWGEPEPIFTQADVPGARRLGCPAVLADEQGFRMWLPRTDAQGVDAILSARSGDGRAWTFAPSTALMASVEGPKRSLSSPDVQAMQAGLRMTLSCGSPWSSLLCTATSVDGERFEWAGGAWLPKAGRHPTELDATPLTRHRDGRWHVWFARLWSDSLPPSDGSTLPTDLQGEIVYTWSKEGDRGRRRDSRVVMVPGQHPEASAIAMSPALTVEEGRPVLYYHGSGPDPLKGGAILRAEADCNAQDYYASTDPKVVDLAGRDQSRRGTEEGMNARGEPSGSPAPHGLPSSSAGPREGKGGKRGKRGKGGRGEEP